MPSGTPSDKGVYLTVYPSSRPNMDTRYTYNLGLSVQVLTSQTNYQRLTEELLRESEKWTARQEIFWNELIFLGPPIFTSSA